MSEKIELTANVRLVCENTKLIRTQGAATGSGWYNHLFYSPELKKGIVKRLHGDEPWWPTSKEPHNLNHLLDDLQNEGKTEKELEKDWHAVCFYETFNFNECRTVSYKNGVLETI
jgi:hypothetical protein